MTVDKVFLLRVESHKAYPREYLYRDRVSADASLSFFATYAQDTIPELLEATVDWQPVDTKEHG